MKRKWTELILCGGGVGGGIEPRVRCPRYPLDHKGDEKKVIWKINKWKKLNELVLYGVGVGGGIEPRVMCPSYPLDHDGDEKKFN